MSADDQVQTIDSREGTQFLLEISPRLPRRLARLEDLAGDLYYSWDRSARGLFRYLDAALWDACGHNPRVFLRRVAQHRLDDAAADRTFLEAYNRALANYDTYLGERSRTGLAARCDPKTDLVAYFCAEFGFHESLPIYSGGLGILAGDFCKAASDIGLPFVAVGLLYRQGNVQQVVDEAGRQHLTYARFDVEDLPVRPATAPDGTEVVVDLELADGPLRVRVWRAKAGHIDLYLLDTDVDGNNSAARALTTPLYPSDKLLRLKQEIVLGIGGTRALRRLGLAPTVWHLNEGHPSLQVIERCRELVADGLPFAAALEQVAASTVFTTHTPVPAGHEIFDLDLFRHHVGPFLRALAVPEEEFLALGRNEHPHAFNLTSFALRCSRYANGVSRIHGRTAARMEQHVWPEVPVSDNPMGHVTNGIHVPTFIAREWVNAIDDPAWRNQLLNADYWAHALGELPDATFWSVHLKLKQQLVADICEAIARRGRRFGWSQAQIDRRTAPLRAGDVLLLGFARRFATYKRATLLFDDPERLRRLLNDPQRPVCLVFAGRAHPSDVPGQELIRTINAFANEPALLGKVILLEGYDLALARRMVTGADVWLNVPEYPLEASGTSGMKAGSNGVLNLSVMDGWWAEGYNGGNGWALQPHDSVADPAERRRLEAKELLDVIEQEVVPLYFDRQQGCSPRWVAMARESMRSIIPRFGAHRMLMDYIGGFYLPAIALGRRLAADRSAGARVLADWKANVRARWSGVRVRRTDTPAARLYAGERLAIRVAADLNGLAPEDVAIECLLGEPGDGDTFRVVGREPLRAVRTEGGATVYELDHQPYQSGLVAYRLRAYPQHALLCHPFEPGLMKWL